jgi:hypothetical protein
VSGVAFTELLTVPCELVRRVYDEDADDAGEQPVVETVEAGVYCEVQTAGSRETSDGAVQITTYRVFLADGVPLTGWDAVRLTSSDELLELEGDAVRAVSPLTGLAHVELVARRTDYGRSSSSPAPPPSLATGATAGEPGYFTPAGSRIPADLDELRTAQPPVEPTPSDAWASFEHVVLDDGTRAQWWGASWEALP